MLCLCTSAVSMSCHTLDCMLEYRNITDSISHLCLSSTVSIIRRLSADQLGYQEWTKDKQSQIRSSYEAYCMSLITYMFTTGILFQLLVKRSACPRSTCDFEGVERLFTRSGRFHSYTRTFVNGLIVQLSI